MKIKVIALLLISGISFSSEAGKEGEKSDRLLTALPIVLGIFQEIKHHRGYVPNHHLARAVLTPPLTDLVKESGRAAIEEATGIKISCPRIVRDIHPLACPLAGFATSMLASQLAQKMVVSPLLDATVGHGCSAS